jgi:predicted RNA-binding Zn-ribbon protein involved in translation (DUF1610 family)
MFGFAGTVTPTEGLGGLSFRSAVHGYCRAHRELVAEGFPAALRAEGDAEIISDPPAELRPDSVARFQAGIDELRVSFVDATGLPGGTYHGDVESAPKNCPHCGATIAWRSGPHLSEAAGRGNAEAWECTGCGAAGMLVFTPH